MLTFSTAQHSTRLSASLFSSQRWHLLVSISPKSSMNGNKTLMATGACVSPDQEDYEDAKMWFNCVEEMVFTDDDFCRDTVTNPDNACILSGRRRLQALQASFMVCLYQNWEGTDAAKRRIRRHRYSTIVAVRAILLSSRYIAHLFYRSHETLGFQRPGTSTTPNSQSTSSIGSSM